ncbi:MAG: protein translocase subunit SecF [Chloroflexi bacterium]|nr:protein translocase subunit SecF [Chloroflexota bacterium]
MDFVGKRWWFLLVSALFILPGLVSLAIPPALRLGIEFTGGSTLDVEFREPVLESRVREQLAAAGRPEAQVQVSGPTSFFVRTAALGGPNVAVGDVSGREELRRALEVLAPVVRFDVSSVSGVVARDTVRNAFLAVAAASVAILAYITWAFRRVPRSFRFGTAAVIALVHDVLVVLGTFSILGKLVGLEVNAMFITGVLTVIGYSVHDTIVVFDRIRENVARAPGIPLGAAVNTSIMETFGRSLNTTLTSLFAVFALLLLGGESIRGFVLVLLVGLLTGTYSSICNASQILVIWETGEARDMLRRLFRARSRA